MKEQISRFFTKATQQSIDGQKPSMKNIFSRAFIDKQETGKVDLLKLILENGEVLKHKFGQWEVTLTQHGCEINNLGPDGKRKFFSTIPMAYDMPGRVIEPDLAFDLPSGLSYVDAGTGTEIDLAGFIYKAKDVKTGEMKSFPQKIGGIICHGENGPRSSLSNPAFKRVEESADLSETSFVDASGKPLTYWHPTSDGIKTFQIKDGLRVDQRWYLSELIVDDKNRVGNVNAVYTLDKHDSVVVGELANVSFRKK